MKKEQGTEPELECALSELREQLDAERSEKRELQETVKKLQTLVNVHTELEAVKKSFEVDVQEVEARIHGRELHMKHLESEGVQLIKKSSTSEPSSLMSLLKSGAPPFDIFKEMFLPYGTSLKGVAELFPMSTNETLNVDVWYTGSCIIDQPEELSAEAFELLSEEKSSSWDLPHEETRAMYLRGELTVLAYPVLCVGYNANLKRLVKSPQTADP
ncbi:hypothetical protein IEO21_09896 [Rhodonia placenta]|uniref:Uncharacterized protein n=1 Tax=Rhodonia placenta TaxID=104341 RepID=A0A8H7TXH2_9APHY|nr:hypothetical protein IEO21_09896 [Postia placenta]